MYVDSFHPGSDSTPQPWKVQKNARDANKVRFVFCWLQGARLVAQAWPRMRVQKERMRICVLSILAISSIVWREKEKDRGKRKKVAIGLVGSHYNVLWCVHGENVASDSGTIGKMGGWVRRLFAKRTSLTVWGGLSLWWKKKKSSASLSRGTSSVLSCFSYRITRPVLVFSCCWVLAWMVNAVYSFVHSCRRWWQWRVVGVIVLLEWGRMTMGRRDGSTVRRIDECVDGARWGKGDTGTGKGGEVQKEKVGWGGKGYGTRVKAKQIESWLVIRCNGCSYAVRSHIGGIHSHSPTNVHGPSH